MNSAHTANFRQQSLDFESPIARSFRTCRIRLSRLLARMAFLQRCLAKKVFPNSFSWKNRSFRGRCKQLILDLPIKLLKAAIRDLRSDIGKCELQCYLTYQQLSDITHPVIFCRILTKVYHLKENIFNSENSKFIKKFNFLSKKSGYQQKADKSPNPAPNSNKFANLSGVPIPKPITGIFDLGPKFIPPTQDNIKEVVTSIEAALNNTTNEQKHLIRTEIASKILQHKNQTTKFTKINKINFKQAKEFFIENDLAVCKADKSGIPVIIENNKLKDKVSEFLTSTNCTLLDKDPTDACAKDVRRLNNLPHLQKFLGDFSPPPFTAAPKLFSQIKLHKPGFPIRPLVSGWSSPLYKLEKCIAKTCQFIVDDSPFKLNSTKDFISRLPNTIDPNACMLTVDVVSLFPSIPVFEAHMLLMKYLINSNTIHNALIKDLYDAFYTLRKFAYFEHGSNFYHQQSGLPMGSPLSPLLAEIVMMHIETNIIFDENLNIQPLLWCRYVDDIFTIWPSSLESLEDILNKAHQKYPTINFTINQENDNKIEFLDVVLRRVDNKLVRMVHRKEIAPTSIIPFQSYTFGPYKLAALKSFIHRANIICNTPESLSSEVENIKQIALSHGFPLSIINKILHNSNRPQSTLSNQNKKDLKFVGTVNFNKFSHIIINSFKKYGYKLAIKPNPNIITCIKLDRSISNPLNSPGVYYIPIADKFGKNSSAYIGSTCRSINLRITEHSKFINKSQYSSLSKFIANHEENTPLWSKVKKLASENHLQHLRVRESLEILTNACCNEDTPRYIPYIWRSIINLDFPVCNNKPFLSRALATDQLRVDNVLSEDESTSRN